MTTTIDTAASIYSDRRRCLVATNKRGGIALYVNRTAAEKRAAQMGPGWEVLPPLPYGRAYLVGYVGTAVAHGDLN